MKIRTIKPFALHNGLSFDVGVTADLPDEDAKPLIKAGFVQEVKEAVKPVARETVEKRAE